MPHTKGLPQPLLRSHSSSSLSPAIQERFPFHSPFPLLQVQEQTRHTKKEIKKSFERHRQIVLVLFSPHSMFFLAHSLSLLLSYLFFFCSTSLVLLPQISLLLTALPLVPRCNALRVPQSKNKKNVFRFFFAFLLRVFQDVNKFFFARRV